MPTSTPFTKPARCSSPACPALITPTRQGVQARPLRSHRGTACHSILRARATVAVRPFHIGDRRDPFHAAAAACAVGRFRPTALRCLSPPHGLPGSAGRCSAESSSDSLLNRWPSTPSGAGTRSRLYELRTRAAVITDRAAPWYSRRSQHAAAEAACPRVPGTAPERASCAACPPR